jgi:hypothetical protein
MRIHPFAGVWLSVLLLWNGIGRAEAADRTRPPEPFKDTFAILSWDLPRWSAAPFSDADHGLASLAQCGFNTAAFVRPQHLAEVERLRTKCILAPQEFPVPWRKLSDEQIEATVKKMVDEAGGSPAVAGYFLADEPGEPDFAALGKAVAAVKKLAPGKLAYINLFPDYATLGAPDLSQLGTASYTDYLEQFVRQVRPQFLSYDNYRIEYSLDQKKPAIAADYYTNLLEVRRVAMEHDLPFWNIVSSNQIQPSTTAPSPANLLLQAYTTLAAGAKGLTWYTYYSTGYAYAPVDKEGHRTVTWSYLRMVNEQVKVLGPLLRPLKSTGVYFTRPQPAPNLPALPGTWVQAIDCPTPLMVGEFVGPHDERYAMVVNLSLTDSVKFKLTPRNPDVQIRPVSPADGALLPREPGNALWLAPGQGVLLAQQPH